MSALISVILILVGMDGTSRNDCDVRCIHCLSHVNPRSDEPRFKALHIFHFVSVPRLSPVVSSPRTECLSVRFFVAFPLSALWVFGHRHRAALDRAPHVRPLQFRDAAVNRSCVPPASPYGTSRGSS